MNAAPAVLLPDGRRLAYAEHGDRAGRPVIFCHGTPGSRLTPTADMASAAARLGIRLIAPDRPGYGLSDPDPQRDLGDWPRDVADLLDALGIRRIGLLGYSLGGVYALACAAAFEARVERVVLCGSLAPDGPPVPTIALARADPAGLRAMLGSLAAQPDALLEAVLANASAPDRAARAVAGIGESLRRDCAATLCQGAAAMIEDFLLAAGDWGFRPGDIRVPVDIWHGQDDGCVPCVSSEWLASRLPGGKLRLLPGEGHLCLYSRWEALLAGFAD